ncbi:MAG: OmpA family protein [Ignavibacteriota bacterium]|jgi:chemotaxis protein MotB|nr:MAG: OmpA family protein [Ignavibacterium sp.]MBL1153681.1 chemotaxis protein MotB [Ignavibacteriota bacterium]MCO6448188.1 OmpA family protein [Ignavibacterium album]MCZ2267971.1 OmpA family protein [Ignavibacteriales bacterium]MDX9711399.1 flagellar motor protein MotB [Ignavibacteriaceae bacterium]
MLGDKENIIVVKKVNKHKGHHGGAWKVAYADFVTAMMALFIVLWVLGQSEEVIKNVAGYFKDPIAFSDKMKGISIIEGGVFELPSDKAKEIIDKVKQREQEIERLNAMKDSIVSNLSSNSDFAYLMDQIKIEIANEGLRIEMIESNDAVFFEIGTSELREDAKKLLYELSKNLKAIPNKLIIEGHTDARPYPNDGRGYTNFELSVDRANSARRVIVASGLDPVRIDEIRGYADTRLLDKKDPFNLVNRRISIIIKFATEAPQ